MRAGIYTRWSVNTRHGSTMPAASESHDRKVPYPCRVAQTCRPLACLRSSQHSNRDWACAGIRRHHRTMSAPPAIRKDWLLTRHSLLFTCHWFIGRGARIRTADLLRPRQARYQAAPRPEMAGYSILPSFFRGVQCESHSPSSLPHRVRLDNPCSGDTEYAAQDGDFPFHAEGRRSEF